MPKKIIQLINLKRTSKQNWNWAKLNRNYCLKAKLCKVVKIDCLVIISSYWSTWFFLDGTFLSAYQLTDGSKLNLILKREAATPTTKSGPSAQNPRSVENFGTPEEELFKALRKHFANDAETRRVVATFMTVRRLVNFIFWASAKISFFQFPDL